MREEGVRRVSALPGLTRCVSTSSEAAAAPASLSPSRLMRGALREPRGVPGLQIPGSGWQPRDLVASPCPRSNAATGLRQSSGGGRGRAAEPPPFPQIAFRVVKPTEGSRKARFWETCGGNGRDLRIKAKTKNQQPQLTPVTSTEIFGRFFFFFSGLEAYFGCA